MRDQFGDPAGPNRRRGEDDRLRKGRGYFDRRLPVAGKPIQRTGVGVMIIRFPRRAARNMIVPVCVNEAFRMLVVRIALVRMVERSLGKREQKARDHAKMKRSTHDSLFYLAMKVSVLAGLGQCSICWQWGKCKFAARLRSFTLPGYVMRSVPIIPMSP